LTRAIRRLAVFEDIDQRDYNPNVSLELGYNVGARKAHPPVEGKAAATAPIGCGAPTLKEFDIFDVATSVEREVGRWIDVDLRLRF